MGRLILSVFNSSKCAYGGIAHASGRSFDTYQFPVMTGGVGRSAGEPRYTCRVFVEISKAKQSKNAPLSRRPLSRDFFRVCIY